MTLQNERCLFDFPLLKRCNLDRLRAFGDAFSLLALEFLLLFWNRQNSYLKTLKSISSAGRYLEEVSNLRVDSDAISSQIDDGVHTKCRKKPIRRQQISDVLEK